jgi:hypothetical protein
MAFMAIRIATNNAIHKLLQLMKLAIQSRHPRLLVKFKAVKGHLFAQVIVEVRHRRGSVPAVTDCTLQAFSAARTMISTNAPSSNIAQRPRSAAALLKTSLSVIHQRTALIGVLQTTSSSAILRDILRHMRRVALQTTRIWWIH